MIEKPGVLSVIRDKNRKPFREGLRFFIKNQSAIGWITKLLRTFDKRRQTHFLTGLRRVIDLNDGNRLSARFTLRYLLFGNGIQGILHQRTGVDHIERLARPTGQHDLFPIKRPLVFSYFKTTYGNHLRRRQRYARSGQQKRRKEYFFIRYASPSERFEGCKQADDRQNYASNSPFNLRHPDKP